MFRSRFGAASLVSGQIGDFIQVFDYLVVFPVVSVSTGRAGLVKDEIPEAYGPVHRRRFPFLSPPPSSKRTLGNFSPPLGFQLDSLSFFLY